jgi:hypothetical protein
MERQLTREIAHDFAALVRSRISARILHGSNRCIMEEPGTLSQSRVQRGNREIMASLMICCLAV